MEKVILTEFDSYGSVTESPEFNTGIQVEFATDMSSKVRSEAIALAEELKTAKESDKPLVEKRLNNVLIKAIVKSWNLYKNEDEKYEISIETIDTFSTKLGSWIMGRITHFFTTMTTTTQS